MSVDLPAPFSRGQRHQLSGHEVEVDAVEHDGRPEAPRQPAGLQGDGVARDGLATVDEHGTRRRARVSTRSPRERTAGGGRG